MRFTDRRLLEVSRYMNNRSRTRFRLPALLTLVFFLVAAGTSPVLCIHQRVNTARVPIARLVANLERMAGNASSGQQKAHCEFLIGRLHSMAYAERTETAYVRADEAPLPRNRMPSINQDEMPFFGYSAAHTQFYVDRRKPATTAAREHLKEAIRHYRRSLELDNSSLPAVLGLAWCLEQWGDRNAAIPLYRRVIREGWQAEKGKEKGMRGESVTAEAGKYLVLLLDRREDLSEIKDIAAKLKHIGRIYTWVTPIAVPLSASVLRANVMEERSVSFRLADEPSLKYHPWISAESGWLVFMHQKKDNINCASDLIGKFAFRLMWRDGYEVLQALDDNGDGILKGNELSNLFLWCDKNKNGRSDRDEIKPVSSFGITALSCGPAHESDGTLVCPGGVVFSNGQKNATYDWYLKPN